MATNVVKILVDDDDNFTVFAGAAIIGKRFVTFAPNLTTPGGVGNKPTVVLAAAAGQYAGVSGADQPLVGGDVDIYTEGIVYVTCSGGLTAGQRVSAGPGGVAVAQSGTAPSYGTCTANTVDGADAPIALQGL